MLCQGMIDGFWETLYPQIEDGDVELRATPLDWIGSRLDVPSAASAYAAMATTSTSTKIRATSLPRSRPRPRSKKPPGKRL